MISEAMPFIGFENSLPSADTLDRVVKIAIDSGEVATVADGYDLFRTYRVGVRVGPEVQKSPAHQAALLTIVNIARRALLGGVYIEGSLDTPLLVPVPGQRTLAGTVAALGGQAINEIAGTMPTLILGSVNRTSNEHEVCLNVIFSDWRGGVVPQADSLSPSAQQAITPAAVLAAAIAVSEIFQNLRGNPMAGRRRVGLSLWSPESIDWENAPTGPLDIVLPSNLWLIGLGHLGQAYLWVLGLLPYAAPSEVMLYLQDFDRLAESNDSTSLLTSGKLIGRLKSVRSVEHRF